LALTLTRPCNQARNFLLIATLLFTLFPVAAQNNPALQAHPKSNSSSND
tara:strand:+ start:231 stop:377 length:147 start_codon:yes stop_codon:yes gene_type:complete